MKLKHLLAMAGVAVMSSSAWAQNPSIQNGGFDTQSDWTTVDIGLNPVVQKDATNWTKNCGASWAGIATFSLGSTKKLNNATVPTTGANGETTGGVMGVASSWSSFAAYEQEITLPAGNYKITYDAYEANSSATEGIDKNLIGFIGGDKEYLSKKTAYTANKWTSDLITFELTEETSGKISVGYKSKNLTSNSTPKLFIDNLAIEYISPLDAAKTNAIANLPTGDASLFTPSAEAVASVNAAIEAATTIEEVNTAAATELTIPALSGSWAILNVTNGLYLGDAVLSAESKTATFEKADGGFYIKIGESYINMKGGDNWSMIAEAEAKTAWTFNYSDNKYTIQGPKGLIGTDATTAGAAVYGNKAASANGYWTVVDVAAAAIESAKVALKGALDSKSAITAGVGDKAFDYPTVETEAYNAVIETAQEVYESATATVESINEQTDAVNALVIPALNAPDPTQAYKIILSNGRWEYKENNVTKYMEDGTAITSLNNRSGQGGYNLQYLTKNDNYAQAMYFNAVTGGYKISFTDVEGNIRYISTGTPYGGNDIQIRTTTNVDDALIIEVRRNGEKLNFYNTAANALIGAQDKGVYTTGSHPNFLVEETTATNDIAVNMATGYATVCLPYAVNSLSNVKAYTVDNVDNDVLVMTEVSALEAKKAYILEGSTNQNFSGVNVAFEAPVANGLLTGVYTKTDVPEGSYILLNQNDKVAFYVVDAHANYTTVPSVAANRAYLTAPAAGARVRAFNLNGNATAIEAISAIANNAIEAIYNANGVKVNALQKGINVVKMQNGKTQKILVK